MLIRHNGGNWYFVLVVDREFHGRHPGTLIWKEVYPDWKVFRVAVFLDVFVYTMVTIKIRKRILLWKIKRIVWNF